MRISEVIQAWIDGETCWSESLTTDGKTLLSYGHRIGYRDERGQRVVIDCHYSRTTKGHGTLAKRPSSRVEPCPDHTTHPAECEFSRPEE